MAAPVAAGKGTFAASASPVLTAPGSIAADGWTFIAIESSDSTTNAGTPDTPSGWTKIYEETQGDLASGVTTLTIFALASTPGQGSVTITGVGNHAGGTMFYVSGAKFDAGTSDIQVGTGAGGSSGAGPVTGITTPNADNLVVAVVACSQDTASTTFFASWTNAGLASITEWEDNMSGSGAGGGIGVAYGVKTAAGATGNTSVTAAGSASPWRAVHLGFQPPSGGAAPEIPDVVMAPLR